MELWQSIKYFYWPLSHPGKKEISSEGQVEFKEKQKAWRMGQEYQGPRNVWREHSDNLVRQHNRKLLLPVINKYIYRNLLSGLMLMFISYLTGALNIGIIEGLSFLGGFCFLCLAGFLVFMRNDGIKAPARGA